MGFRVWGLGFGVWGLGFGVWGLLAVHEVKIVTEIRVTKHRHINLQPSRYNSPLHDDASPSSIASTHHDVPAAALHRLQQMVHQRDAEAKGETCVHCHALVQAAKLINVTIVQWMKEHDAPACGAGRACVCLIG